MPGKHCCYGECKSDSRYPERFPGVKFFPIPKPLNRLEETKEWIKACGRPHDQLNPERITKHHYVCSKPLLLDLCVKLVLSQLIVISGSTSNAVVAILTVRVCQSLPDSAKGAGLSRKWTGVFQLLKENQRPHYP
ncbi:hypothetical protein BaRGS_00029391 [Batillaria attramentaria]|uniref:THAP-type domain-containing protein n=2 Tax=Batillaria attramentaria TaxID=370345 RepID=A0ABD0JWK5_9CAEN